MASKLLSNAAILAQTARARSREAAARRSGLRARSARYDARKNLVVAELSNGVVFGFPPPIVPGLRGRTPSELSKVALSPSGAGLHWDDLDVDVSVVGVLFAAFSDRERRSELGRLAGSVRSAAKTRAARRNGTKGGRPPKR